MNRPFVSVVVPTHNRKAMLANALASLAVQDYPADRYEIIVVDDGSEDGTWEWVVEEASRWNGRLIPLRQENKGPAAARNRGVAESQGVLAAFTDDDCIASPTWLSELMSGYVDSQVAGVGGQVLPYTIDHWLERYYAHSSVLQRPAAVDGSIEYLITANASFRREPFLQMGGFDERLTFAAGEDADLCARLKSHGYGLRYHAEALVYHHYRRSLRVFLHTFYRYGVGTTFYECLHYGRVTSRYWRWSLAWLRWPRDFVHYRLRGQPWGDAFHFAWLDAARDTMLLIGIVRGRLLYRRIVA